MEAEEFDRDAWLAGLKAGDVVVMFRNDYGCSDRREGPVEILRRTKTLLVATRNKVKNDYSYQFKVTNGWGRGYERRCRIEPATESDRASWVVECERAAAFAKHKAERNRLQCLFDASVDVSGNGNLWEVKFKCATTEQVESMAKALREGILSHLSTEMPKEQQ